MTIKLSIRNEYDSHPTVRELDQVKQISIQVDNITITRGDYQDTLKYTLKDRVVIIEEAW